MSFVVRRETAGILGQGLMAGLAGTLLLGPFERLERRALGRQPVYAPARIVARLARRMGVTLTVERRRRFGRAARWLYGPAMGIASRVVDPSPASRAARALRVGATIFGVELVMLPFVGAVPPLGDWPLSEILALAAHTTAFALGAEVPGVVRSAAAVML